MEQILKIGLEDIASCFGIEEDLYEKYVLGEIVSNQELRNLIVHRDTMGDWQKETPLGGPGTILNGIVLYSLIRHYNLERVLETGVSGGFYTAFLMAALNKYEDYPPFLTSVDISDDKSEVGKLIPPKLHESLDWQLILGIDSLDFLKTDDRMGGNHQLFCHDSLHTLSHMMKELIEFKKCNLDQFFVYIDDQASENFWKIALQTSAFYKVGYDVKYISGAESRLNGHLGGFIKFDKR